MTKGLPKAYIKKWGVTKLAWQKFRAKALSTVKRSKKRKTTKRKKTRRKTNLVRRKRRRRSSAMTIPLAPVLGLAAGLAGPIGTIMTTGDWESALNQASMNYTGYNPADGTFMLDRLKTGVLPVVIGLLVHKFVGGSPLNLNRILAQAKVPFLRI